MNESAWLVGLIGGLLLIGCQQVLSQPTVSLGKEAYAVCVTATPVAIAIEPPLIETVAPYYKVEVFGMGEVVHVDGMTLKFVDWDVVTSEVDGFWRHRFRFEVTNHTVEGVLVPLSRILFVRRVLTAEGEVKEGRWVGEGEGELRPLALRERRIYEVSVLAPAGVVQEVGVLTEWRDGVAGGVPIWFVPQVVRPGCAYGWADVVGGDVPPRPTPHIIGYGGGGVRGVVGVCTRPLRGPLVRGFGCSGRQTGIDEPFGCGGDAPYFHNGWDVDGYVGDTVLAPIGGVVESGFDEKLGIFVRVIGETEQHDLLHLSSSFVGDGQRVAAGEAVGEVGNSGNSEGAHLHWTVRREGRVIDPAGWSCEEGG